jgi:hypothetical protein
MAEVAVGIKTIMPSNTRLHLTVFGVGMQRHFAREVIFWGCGLSRISGR